MIQIEVINPSNWERTNVMNISIPTYFGNTAVQLYNSNNLEILSQLKIDSQNTLNITFVAEEVPANGSKFFFLKDRDINADLHLPEEGLLDGNDYYLENDLLRAIVEEDGSITIMDKDPDVNDSTSDEKKLIIMGEELGNGSIWAGDSFFYFSKLNQFEFKSEILKVADLHYKLKFANDFGGTIEINYNLLLKTEKIAEMVTLMSINKGESSLINFQTYCNSYANNFAKEPLNILFPLKLAGNTIIENKGVYGFWNDKMKHGLTLLSEEKIRGSKFESSDSCRLDLSFTCENHTTLSSASNYALVPLRDYSNENLQTPNNSIYRYAEEFFIPLIAKFSEII